MHPQSSAIIFPETFDSPRPQHFSLPQTFLQYFSKDRIVYEKLLKTCKWFFATSKPIIFVYKGIVLEKNILFYETYKQPISRTFQYWFIGHFYANENSLSIRKSNIIFHCNLESLEIENRKNLTLKELNFFLNGGQIKSLRLKNVIIQGPDRRQCYIDKILAKTPKLEYLNYICENEIFINRTFENLASLEFSSKKSIYFCISIFQVALNADFKILCKFIENNKKRNMYNDQRKSDYFIFRMKMYKPDAYISRFQADAIKILNFVPNIY